MADKRLKTMQLSGNEYAKVADRIKAFREDWPHSKIETVHHTNEDGSVEFTSYLWKDKTDLIDLMKAGVTDVATLRSSADSNGRAKGEVGKKVKDYEKLETVANGRALANIGYLGSGEIASFEEMEAFNEYKNDQKAEAIRDAIESLNSATTLEELRDAFIKSNLMQEPEVVAAKDKRKGELSDV